MKKEFDKAKRPKKDVIRRLVAKEMINSNSPMSKPILTLPSHSLIFEKLLMRIGSSKFKFLACESNPLTYVRMMKAIGDKNHSLRFDTHYGKLSDIIFKAKENEFSHIYADYCGQLNSFYKEIEYAIKNNIVCVDGVIAITMNDRISPGCKGYGGNEGIIEMIEAVAPNPNWEGNTKTTHVVEEFIKRIGGYSYHLDLKKIVKYHDVDDENVTRGNMMAVIIRRIR